MTNYKILRTINSHWIYTFYSFLNYFLATEGFFQWCIRLNLNMILEISLEVKCET